MYQGSPLFQIFLVLSCSLHRQPNLGLPRTRRPLTSAINTLLAIRTLRWPKLRQSKTEVLIIIIISTG